MSQRLILSLTDSSVQYLKFWLLAWNLVPQSAFKNRPPKRLNVPEAALRDSVSVMVSHSSRARR
jgi:hypothetical protein